MSERLQLSFLLKANGVRYSRPHTQPHYMSSWGSKIWIWIQPEMKVDFIKNKQTMTKVPQNSEVSKEMMIMAVKSILDACEGRDERGWDVAPNMSVIFLIQWLPRWMIERLVVQWLLNRRDYILVRRESGYYDRASEPPTLHFETLRNFICVIIITYC